VKTWIVRGVAIALIIALTTSLALALTVFKDVMFHGTVIDEAENVDVFVDAACTTVADSIQEVGDMQRGEGYVYYLYGKNISDTRTTVLRAELIDVPSWADTAMEVVPTEVTLAPGESVEFQVGIIVPTSAPLGDMDWGVRFFEDDTMPVAEGVYIPALDAYHVPRIPDYLDGGTADQPIAGEPVETPEPTNPYAGAFKPDTEEWLFDLPGPCVQPGMRQVECPKCPDGYSWEPCGPIEVYIGW